MLQSSGSSEASAGAHECAFHPGRETLLSCTRCDKWACPDCLEPAAIGAHCVGCRKGRPVAGAKGETKFRVRSALFGADEDAKLRRPGAVFYALLFLFLGLCAVAYEMEGFAARGGSWNALKAISIAVVIVGAVLSVTIHEWAHAFVAYHGGDKTVVSKGYLTMDPRHYSDPYLSIIMPLIFLLLGGLPLPGGAVWIEHRWIRNKWWDSAVSLAGPASNLVFGLVLLGIGASGVLGHHLLLHTSLVFLAYLEFGIVILNMIPIPGLDGYGAIDPFLPDNVRETLAPVRRYGIFVLLVLVMNGGLNFIWDWSTTICTTLGVPIDLLALGYQLASPKLFG